MKIETCQYINNEVVYSNLYVNKKKLLRFLRKLNWGSIKEFMSEYTYDDSEYLVDVMDAKGASYKRVVTGTEPWL